MKKKLNLFSLLLPLVLLQLNLFAQDDNDKDNKDDKKKYEFVKNKAVNKSYNVSSGDKLHIENSFGSVEVHTWDRNEIKVDVSIEVSASTNDLAQRIIDGITIADRQNGKGISFTTTIKGTNNTRNEKSTMHVNYNISMPSVNPLDISNEFGATVIPDYKGELDVTSKFGSLTTGNLANAKSLQVEFGRAKFENINNGDISIKYSKSEFARFTGNIKLNLEFCSAVKMNLDNGLTGLDIKASYSTVNLKPTSDLQASYSILTSFGGLKNRTSLKFDSDEDDGQGTKFDHQYTGKSGSGAVQVKVHSSFSNIILGEPEPGDIKEKSKSKSKA